MVVFPRDFAEWLLNYFYQKPMNEAEQVVNAIRQLIAQADAQKAPEPEANVETPVQEQQ